MKASVVPIGNSKGIRIPKAVLELCQIGRAVHLEVQGDVIVLRPLKRRPRTGWDEACRTIHAQREDALLLDETLDLDLGPWEW